MAKDDSLKLRLNGQELDYFSKNWRIRYGVSELRVLPDVRNDGVGGCYLWVGGKRGPCFGWLSGSKTLVRLARYILARELGPGRWVRAKPR